MGYSYQWLQWLCGVGLWLKLTQNTSCYLNPCAVSAHNSLIRTKFVKNLVIVIFYQEGLPLYRILRKNKENFFVFSQISDCHKKVTPFTSHKRIFVRAISFNIKTYLPKVNVVWTERWTVNNIFISNIAK